MSTEPRYTQANTRAQTAAATGITRPVPIPEDMEQTKLPDKGNKQSLQQWMESLTKQKAKLSTSPQVQ